MLGLLKNWIFNFSVAAFSVGMGVLMLPAFGIGVKIVHLIFAVLVLVFMFTYLVDRIRRKRGYAFITATVEFIILAVITVLLLLGQFNVFGLLSVCGALGLILWIHGVLAIIPLYLSKANVKNGKVSLVLFLSLVGVISVGAYLFARPIIADKTIATVISVTFFATAVIFIALGIFFLPTKKSKKMALPSKSKRGSK